MLLVTLAGIIALQVLAVQLAAGAADLRDWRHDPRRLGIATGVAASVLILEEGRKLAMALLARLGYRAMPAESV